MHCQRVMMLMMRAVSPAPAAARISSLMRASSASTWAAVASISRARAPGSADGSGEGTAIMARPPSRAGPYPCAPHRPNWPQGPILRVSQHHLLGWLGHLGRLKQVRESHAEHVAALA